eukprot:15250545-Heterocapsa_arctica.AAC.1
MEVIVVNKKGPLWMQKSDDAINEEHVSFYNLFLNDWEDHCKIEDLSIGMTMNEMINNLGAI